MRLIDADALTSEVQTCYKERRLSEFSKDIVARFIDGAPTIDAEPVRHGEWIETETELICSECECEITSYDTDFLPGLKRVIKYCPFCGAEMDKE